MKTNYQKTVERMERELKIAVNREELIKKLYAERVRDCYRSIFGRILYSTGMACMF